jgi:hypothetical protein
MDGQRVLQVPSIPTRKSPRPRSVRVKLGGRFRFFKFFFEIFFKQI